MDEINLAVQYIKEKLPSLEIRYNEPFSKHTTFKIGGPVSVMLFPESTECTSEICNILYKHKLTPFIIGNGSNILASDNNHELIIINTSKLSGMALIDYAGAGVSEENPENYRYISADAGVLLSALAEFACDSGLSGLEFAHGIPGTTGGAVVMNAGAYGGEMKDVVIETTVFCSSCGVTELTEADNDFSYRHSRFSDCDDVLLSAVFKLRNEDSKVIRHKINDLNSRRQKSQPLDTASGGSIFKRPKEGYAAALIEQSGLKGYKIGGAQVSEKHSGFIVNNGNATFDDVITLIEHVREVVHNNTGTLLEPEIKIVR
ncbi:MAG: UDP-N-acetylmuramate dehydrogenase [Oscillospiraceae bacterium]|nr:UDP-N-acetylmuramate dehydrogenase [Oscillospiraceae bacterium]